LLEAVVHHTVTETGAPDTPWAIGKGCLISADFGILLIKVRLLEAVVHHTVTETGAPDTPWAIGKGCLISADFGILLINVRWLTYIL